MLRRRVKAELRKRLRALRQTTPSEACAGRSQLIVERLAGHLANARAVALFWPLLDRHEVDLRKLDTGLRKRGARVAYPAGAAQGRVVLRFVADAASLEDRGNGYLEPAETDAPAPLDELDAVVVPAIAVDPAGHRIGYGGGYYDRLLAQRGGRTEPTFLAVAYDFQLVAEVPTGPQDVAVDWVITDKRAFPAGEGAG